MTESWRARAEGVARLAALDPSGVVLLHRLAHRSYARGRRLVPYLVRVVLLTVYGAEIHPAAVLGRGVRFAHTSGVVIGRDVRIGDDVEIYSGVVLGHSGDWTFPIIGDGVTLYSHACVVGAVTVGAGARVGANAVVLADVPPGATAVGAPARIVPSRS